jgi:hypothetical protein
VLARSLARSLKELSATLDEGLGRFDSLTVNG